MIDPPPAENAGPEASARSALGGDLRPVPGWVAPAFAVLALGTLPWIAYLLATLDPDTPTVHYRAAWVGFDTMLVLALGATAYFAWRGTAQVAYAATVTATMLVIDAWFDVVTTPPGRALAAAVALALVAELPLAAVCLWLATHARQVLRRRVELLARRAQRAERIAMVERAVAAGVARSLITDAVRDPADLDHETGGDFAGGTDRETGRDFAAESSSESNRDFVREPARDSAPQRRP